MRPFHTVLGAVGFLEQNASGRASVLLVSPKGKKLFVWRVEFDYDPVQSWTPRRKEVARAYGA